MTAEELLATMAEPFAEGESYCTIDPETRVITIPPEYQLLGVESDEKAERLYFKCPKIVGDNIDLTTLALRVNFRNAGAVVDQYLVDDVDVEGDDITFSWLLSRRVTQYEGTVNFIVCAVKVSGDTITNEWNTTLAQAEVLEGLEVEVTLPEEETDIVSQLLALAETRLNDVRQATTDANAAAENANVKAQEAENAAEDARDVIDQITKDSYLHTALQSFIDSVKASPTAYGNAIVKKIEGFTRQETTTGAQLFDINTISTQGSTTYKIINDTTVEITGGKSEQNVYSNVNFSMDNVKSLIQGKKIYLYCKFTGDHKPQGQLAITPTSGSTTYKSVWSNSWAEVDIPSDCKNIVFGLYPTTETGTTETVTFSDIKIGLTQFETWEPYTGGQPAPNPDYPMAVQGTGYRGFFDGLLLQGYWDVDTSNFKPYANYVCNQHKIECNQNDEIEIFIEDDDVTDFLIIFFDENDKKISYSTNRTATAPQGVKTMGFRYRKTGITPQTAGHITVKINGMYAICVKSIGKNLCYFDETLKNCGITPDADGVYYIPTANTLYKSVIWRNEQKISGSVHIRYTRKFEPYEGAGGAYPWIYYTDGSADIMGSSPVQTFQTVTIDTDESKTVDYIMFSYGSYNAKTWIKELMISRENMDYVEPQNGAIYIPVDYPLFEGDKIIQRNGEYKLLRKWGMSVFDGSEDESWGVTYVGTYHIYNSCIDLPNPGKESSYVVCDRFDSVGLTASDSYVDNNAFISGSGKFNLMTSSDRSEIQGEESLKTWLQSNPVTVVYELAEPTEETLSPEAQKALHSIMATDEQTELTIVGVPADAEISNQFLLPRNEDGALNTTAYCTSVKNKLTLDELLSQSLDSRVNKLEIDNAALADQTIVVE